MYLGLKMPFCSAELDVRLLADIVIVRIAAGHFGMEMKL
jgi:hypothetical protein